MRVFVNVDETEKRKNEFKASVPLLDCLAELEHATGAGKVTWDEVEFQLAPECLTVNVQILALFASSGLYASLVQLSIDKD
jgi:hypothetical protein